MRIPLGSTPPSTPPTPTTPTTVLPTPTLVVTTPTAPNNSSASSNPQLVAYLTAGIPSPPAVVSDAPKLKEILTSTLPSTSAPSIEGDISSDESEEPLFKKPRSEFTAKLYEWRVSNSSGELIEKSATTFLAYNNCQKSLDVNAKPYLLQDAQVLAEVRTYDVKVPPPSNIARRVYRFLLDMEVKESAKKGCNGCKSPAGENADHADGCLASMKAQAEAYGEEAHNKIGSVSLLNCCSFITAYLGNKGYVGIKCVDAVLGSSDPVQVLQQGEAIYEAEYAFLRHY